MPPTGPWVRRTEVHTCFGEAALLPVLSWVLHGLLSEASWPGSFCGSSLILSLRLKHKGSCQKQKCLETQGLGTDGGCGPPVLFHLFVTLMAFFSQKHHFMVSPSGSAGTFPTPRDSHCLELSRHPVQPLVILDAGMGSLSDGDCGGCPCPLKDS